jgi:uncharacterized cupin superfamily protein
MPPSHVRRVTRDGPPEPADAAPDRLVAGSGASAVWNAFSDPSGRFHVGHWTSEPGIRRVAYDETEFCVILEGRVRLEGEGGAVEFGPGEAFVIEGGFAGTWESIGRVVKLYAILEP